MLAWFIKPIGKIVTKLVPEVYPLEKEIEEPKFLNEKILQYPETVIASLLDESKYLYKNAIFEIVAHALNIHRVDIISDLAAKKVVKKSVEDFKTDVRALYLHKVKTIYGEIIRYATNAQSSLKLSEIQNKRIMQIKLANRIMVEIIRDIGELNRNVSKYLDSENRFVKQQYNKFRKSVVKVLRAIHMYRTEKENQQKYHEKLMALQQEAMENIYKDNLEINELIRDDKITTDMASSLVNDHDNVNKLITKLITVAEILFIAKDPLMNESGEDMPRKVA